MGLFKMNKCGSEAYMVVPRGCRDDMSRSFFGFGGEGDHAW